MIWMISAGFLPVRGSKRTEWMNADHLCESGTSETEIVLFECKCYDQIRGRWMSICHSLDEKK